MTVAVQQQQKGEVVRRRNWQDFRARMNLVSTPIFDSVLTDLGACRNCLCADCGCCPGCVEQDADVSLTHPVRGLCVLTASDLIGPAGSY